MATLEKIRSKSVMLFIVIIVALLAFILGDFFNSGQAFFGSGLTVAKAGDVTVEYPEYQNRISELSEQFRQQGRELSSDAISDQALNSLIAEGLMKQEYEDLGITVTTEELNQAIFGETPSPMVNQVIAQLSGALGLATPSAQDVYNAAQDPARYNITAEDAAQIAQILRNTENDIEQQMLSAKFGRLMSGLFTYNKLDAQATFNNVATTHKINYAVADASTISDEEIEFSDADVEALWNSRREEYRLVEPTRLVDYVYVRIEPSTQDRIAAAEAVRTAVSGLNNTEGLSAIDANAHFITEEGKATRSMINDHNLGNFLDSAIVGQAQIITRNPDEYIIAKLFNTFNGVDSMNVSYAHVAPGVNADSIVAAINAGSTVDQLGSDEVQGLDSIWQNWQNLEAINVAEIRTALANAPVGRAFLYTDSINGVNSVYKVNKRNAPVKFYEFATISYTVDPSPETLDKLSSDLRSFVSNNSSAELFSANASENGYPILSDEISASSIRIGSAEDSRLFIKWAMEAKKGQVSPVFGDDQQTYLIAIAVKDIYGDYVPYTSPNLYTMLKAEALNKKKASKLMEKFAGQHTTLADYASAMETTVQEGSVNLTAPMLLNIGIGESTLNGTIAATPQGQLTGPIQGNHGILVFEVSEISTANRPFNEEEYGQQFFRNFSPLRNPSMLLLGDNVVENLSLNFIANPAE